MNKETLKKALSIDNDIEDLKTRKEFILNWRDAHFSISRPNKGGITFKVANAEDSYNQSFREKDWDTYNTMIHSILLATRKSIESAIDIEIERLQKELDKL